MKVNFVDILLYTVKTLKQNYPSYNIYIDANEKKIDIPSFYVEVTPIRTTEKLWGSRYKKVDLMIQYVNKQGRNQDRLRIIDELEELFSTGIRVRQSNEQERVISIFDKKPTIINSRMVAYLSIDLEYYDGYMDDNYDPNRAYDDLMEILSLNVVIKNDKE